MRKLIFMSLSLLFLNSKLLAATAHLSESEIFEYQTVELVLSGSQNSTPDLAPLEKAFEILNTSTQSSMQIVNGQVQISENNVHLRLQPKRTGTAQHSSDQVRQRTDTSLGALGQTARRRSASRDRPNGLFRGQRFQRTTLPRRGGIRYPKSLLRAQRANLRQPPGRTASCRSDPTTRW